MGTVVEATKKEVNGSAALKDKKVTVVFVLFEKEREYEGPIG
ncbi:hypothetical protein CASFOL_007569 [Castilleja foliolosa]|uniref:Uncharacterized protein n=1 Tax=Castilleja foliolosa TaxID=1961234 RepID=A0ABD3EAG2_9LAMI